MNIEDEESLYKCPDCKGDLIILKEWVNIHDKESLWHCWDCDAIYHVFYKLDRIVKLIEESINIEVFLDKVKGNDTS